MRLWIVLGLLSCSDGFEMPSDDLGLGPSPKMNPLETIDDINNRPKCELPSVQQVASIHAGHIAGTQPAARDGFESVNALFEEVAKPMPDVRACRPTPFSQSLTNGNSHRVSGGAGAPYQHLTELTFVPDRHPQALSRAVGDLYLHGKRLGLLAKD